MSRAKDLSIKNCCWIATALLMVFASAPARAQQQAVNGETQLDLDYINQPLVEDWSTRHVIFSNPGTLEDARRNGKEESWWRVVTDPRYRMQWVKRYALWSGSKASGDSDLSNSSGFEPDDGLEDAGKKQRVDWRDERRERSKLHGDWSVSIGASAASPSQSVAADMFPAKFTFTPIGPPDCVKDFVVYPVANSASGNANIVGVNNLYTGTCSTSTGPIPTVLFAYNVGTGSNQTSPSLSMDGTKAMFIESLSTGSYLHIITLDKSGNAGCVTPITSSTTPCNGTAYNAAVPACTVNTITTAGASGPSSTTTTKPCSYNAAVDNRILIYANGNSGPMITRSSPFVDYKNDIAYLGDDNGNLHKFTNVFGIFGGAPAEVTISGYWPSCTGSYSSSCGSAPVLSSPVVDGCSNSTSNSSCPGGVYGSGLVVIGGSTGTLFGDPTSYGGYAGIAGFGGYNFTTKTVTVDSSILDAPILDGTQEKVFVAGNAGTGSNSSSVVLTQIGLSTTASTSTGSTPFVSGSTVTAPMGATGADTFDGTFDNVYFTSTSGTGYMYFCGDLSGAATPTLLRVGITNGTMSSTPDTSSFQLVATGNTGTSYDCTPLTEFFNTTSGIDYLFLGVKNNGAPLGCSVSSACVMSFSLPTTYTTPGSSVAFPAVVAATTIPSGSTPALNGASGIIIDNASGSAGASQIYFGNLNAGTGVQMSQAALK
jgi:hypothetical protein